MAKNPFHAPLSEDAFTKAEAGMKIDKIGNGSYNFDAHGSEGFKGRSSRIQSPAQHASVKKAAAASAAKRSRGKF